MGAIEKVAILGRASGPDHRRKAPQLAFCGSGLIDCLAKPQDGGIIDRTGQFIGDRERLRPSVEGREFVLVRAGEGPAMGDIVITEGDIKT